MTTSLHLTTHVDNSRSGCRMVNKLAQEVKEEEPEELDEPCPQVVLTEEDKVRAARDP